MLDKYVVRKFKYVARIIKPGSRVLDIGCDNGELKNFLPENTDYFGIDADVKGIAEAKRKGIKVRLMNLNTEKLNLNKRFDYIIMLDVLEHVVNPAKAINETKNCLKQDGKMIISLPNDYNFLNKIRFLLNKEIVKNPFAEFSHLHIFTIKEGENFLKRQGLTIIRKDFLYPSRPKVLPSFIRKILTNIFPNNFARGTIYLLKKNELRY